LYRICGRGNGAGRVARDRIRRHASRSIFQYHNVLFVISCIEVLNWRLTVESGLVTPRKIATE
jgi:hypothetical protein